MKETVTPPSLLNIPLGNKTELNSITLSAGKKIISWLEASKLLFYFQWVASADLSLIASLKTQNVFPTISVCKIWQLEDTIFILVGTYLVQIQLYARQSVTHFDFESK